MGAVTGFLGLGGGAQGTGQGGPSGLPQDYTGMANLQTTYQGLKGIAEGTGPNPAQAQYQTNMQNLQQQQAGAINSIQGISPAQKAALISQQGSGMLQNNAAQAEANTMAQQLGAYGSMAGVAGNQAQIAAGMQQNVNNNNTQLAGGVMGNQGKAIGGMFNGASSAAMMAAMAAMNKGGSVKPQMSSVGRFMSGGMQMRTGGTVPGRAQVAGDSRQNDTVAAMLSPGEIVVPRSKVMQGPEAAARFVAAVMAKKGKR